MQWFYNEKVIQIIWYTSQQRIDDKTFGPFKSSLHPFERFLFFRSNVDRRDLPADFQDLAVERKAGNIDAKSRIKLDTISKTEYNSIIKSLCDLKTDLRGEIIKMNKKVTKMEEIMSDFLKKLNDAFPDASTASNSTTLLDGMERRVATNENKVYIDWS